jgi:hypothetical protein
LFEYDGFCRMFSLQSKTLTFIVNFFIFYEGSFSLIEIEAYLLAVLIGLCPYPATRYGVRFRCSYL